MVILRSSMLSVAYWRCEVIRRKCIRKAQSRIQKNANTASLNPASATISLRGGLALQTGSGSVGSPVPSAAALLELGGPLH